MSRRDRGKGRLPPFVPLLRHTLASAAWTELSHGAKALYVELKSKYRHESHNNGHLFLPQRDARLRLGGSGFTQIARWYRELQHFGFIRMTKTGALGVEGKGEAPHWRLTELGYRGDPATNDFEKWGGSPFVDKKTESRSRNLDRTAPESRSTPAPENKSAKREHRSRNLGHIAEAKRSRNLEHTKYTTTSAHEADHAEQVRRILKEG